MITRLTVLLLCLATPGFAEPLGKSPRPGGNPRLSAVTLSHSDAAPASPGAAGAIAAPASASAAPASGLRPRPRPAALEQVAALAPAVTPPLPTGQAMLRPRARPASVEARAAAAMESPSEIAAPRREAENASLAAAPEAKKSDGPTSFSRPKDRSEDLKTASANTPRGKDKAGKKPKEKASSRGSVCGVAAIKGEPIAPITSKVQGCGLQDGVRVTSVSGVRLSMAVTIDCATAKALNRWVESAAQPAYGNQIVELKIAGHYVCRPRNNKKGAKVSEHGRGKAVDISGFRLSSGKVLPVLKGFDAKMRKAHRGACGIFGTTLGPGSDGYHEDHLHFDTASQRNGPYCR
ncbi:extensin-like domain-containing protein [Pseudogemmobacter faecipullorum]|uniref:Extensin family protein n=1 Tax=Pseudogemmobacter faecipullorum TaxID=2755041 RepID=A0ABS8CHT3_9RHOB|nr:extensin family protein [Pseudogemmobacter faecipullorum]MCB5408947.1 extensin family protein [Pseudogemmobacter faecipullorum]